MQVIREMNTLKDALGDYMYDNYNRSQQGQFLKVNEGTVGLNLPLKDDEIKVTKRDQVLIKNKNNSERKPDKERQKQLAAQYWGSHQKKKSDYKEYDLKTNKIIERRKKKKPHGADSDSDF